MPISRLVSRSLYGCRRLFASSSVNQIVVPYSLPTKSLARYSTNAFFPPRVPSTQHVEPYDLATSAFFAGHRPLNIPLLLLGSPNKQQIDKAVEMFGRSTISEDKDLENRHGPRKPGNSLSGQPPFSITFLQPHGKNSSAQTIKLLDHLHDHLQSILSSDPRKISFTTLDNTENEQLNMELTSVKRKRKLKMNKHKFQKRKKLQRALMRKLGK